MLTKLFIWSLGREPYINLVNTPDILRKWFAILNTKKKKQQTKKLLVFEDKSRQLHK